MEFLEKLGDWINEFTAKAERFITRLFGSSNERRIREIGFVRDRDGNDTIVPGSVLDQINQLAPEMEKLSDDELKETAPKLRRRLADGETLDDVLPHAFAAVREAGRRYLKMRHYDVQLIGGYVLHKGMIAEMVTGEGKTLVATLPAFLNGLAGHVHIVTVNDYLAKRDMEWMAPIYLGLGLTVDAIQANMSPQRRRQAYSCDITFGTNNEFGFDYLRDNMKPTSQLQVQGPLDFAIVDEIDNILIDEARTPLIISGPAHDDVTKYAKANRVALQLKRDVDFEVKEKEHTCHLTDEGVKHAEQLAGVESFYTAGNMEWPHLIDNSLKAHHLYKRDVNYVVQDGQVVIVDEFTGRLMPGRQWSDGLHQAVEAKEGVRIKEESQTFATITLQNYFKLYNKLAGMTGTAMTEAQEFWKIYKLDILSIPTNRPLTRVNYPDVIYRTEKEKWKSVVNEIREIHATGRPILVGTVSIEKSELLSEKLGKMGIQHNVLNAKHHEREAEIIAQAGRYGAVTIATNMAGRGTDIILGGNPEHMAWDDLKDKYESRLDVPKAEWNALIDKIAEREGMDAEGRKVAEVGGLHVIGTERHDARRIDLQLRGRSGRQGDPGSSRFFLSLEDDLMRIFAGDKVKSILNMIGMKEDEAIESPMVTRRIEAAQKKVEERHFESRKHLLEYDEVMDDQRKKVYTYRQRILDGADCRQLILSMIDRQVDRWTGHFLDPDYRWETCAAWAAAELKIEVTGRELQDMDRDQMVEYLQDEAYKQSQDLIAEQIDENLPEEIDDEREWNWLALSKWANAHFGLNTNDRELKKVGRDDLFDYLVQRAQDAMQRFDFSPLDHFLADDWGRRSLCSWLSQQYSLDVKPEEFEELTPPEAADLVREKVRKLYYEKEIEFPVAVGIANFLADKQQQGGGREALVRWANTRFQTELKVDDLKNKTRNEIHKLLSECSRTFFVNGENVSKIDEYLDRAYGERNGHPAGLTNGQPSANGAPEAPEKETVERPEALEELIRWANEEFHASLDLQEVATLDREQLRQRLLQEHDECYRPELRRAERMLILEVLDTAWKDHLYHMDHLRSGIGLVGYAQKDPKVEYKREGVKAFESMWDRIGEQVTGAIFRLEKQSPEFVGSLWKSASTVEQDPDAYTLPEAQQETATATQPEPGSEKKPVDPIRNRLPKVGRNDPCPCGSGKKFKKCCGKQ